MVIKLLCAGRFAKAVTVITVLLVRTLPRTSANKRINLGSLSRMPSSVFPVVKVLKAVQPFGMDLFSSLCHGGKADACYYLKISV